MINYEFRAGRFIKDGHTVMPDDVLKDLKRKAYLEAENEKLKRAVEHGGYLVDSAKGFLKALNESAIDGEGFTSSDSISDHWGGLESSIYEFKKRC